MGRHSASESETRRIRWRVRKRDAFAAVLLGLLQSACLVVILLGIRVLVDSLAPVTVGSTITDIRERSLRWGAVLAGACLAYGFLVSTEFRVIERAGYRVVQRLRMDMYRHLQGMLPDQLQHRARGGLLLRFIGDLSMLRMWVSRGILGGTVALIVLACGVGMLIWLDGELAIAALAVLHFGAAVSLLQGRRMRSVTRTMRRRRSLVTGNIDEQIQALSTVQSFGRLKGEEIRLSRQNDALTESLIRLAAQRGRLRGISHATAMLAVVAVLVVGLIEVARFQTTVGSVVAAVIVTRLLMNPVRQLALAHDYWHRGQVSRRKIEDFLASSSLGSDQHRTQPLRVTRGRIDLIDISVPGRVHGITQSIDAREIVAITGAQGSGKSSVIQLIARQLLPEDGVVLVDGQPIDAAPQGQYERQLGLVSDDLPLMRGTIRRTLTYGARKADDAEILRVCHALGLGELLATVDGGLNHWITERGGNLSSTQRRLLCLARATIGHPRILLLDEPTRGLEPAAAQTVRSFIARYRGTVVLTSNDPADLALAERVWELDRGRLTQVRGIDEIRDSAAEAERRLLNPWHGLTASVGPGGQR